jgi:PAS domain S-box-containing protein
VRNGLSANDDDMRYPRNDIENQAVSHPLAGGCESALMSSGYNNITGNILGSEIWNSSPDNLFIVKMENGVFILEAINPAQEKALGLIHTEVANKPLFEVLPAALAQRVSGNYQRCIDSGKVLLYDEPYVDEAGNYSYWETQLIPIIKPELGISYIFGRSRNITRARETERRLEEARRAAEHANEVKTAFLANMSHEMRTPLNGIAGAATLLAGTENPAEKHELLAVIDASVSAMSRLTNDILDYAKLNAGTLKLQLAELTFPDLVAEVFGTVQSMAAPKSLQLLFTHNGIGNLPLLGDRDRIKQVLTNLVTNAIKFTNSGNVSVDITCKRINEKLELACVQVSDTGIGIAEEDLKRLFEPFTQIDNSSTRRYAGAGLGLAITRQLVNLMGGNITVFSSLGQGSRFQVELPLLHGKATQKLLVAGEIPQLQGNVLLVEDNATNRLVAQKMLRSVGLDVVTAEHGAEALQFFAAREFDLVLMDWHMPVMDGLEATRRIRATNERGATIPIIALTANVLEDQREQCLNAGMNDVLTKPISRDMLIGMLLQWLKSTPNH